MTIPRRWKLFLIIAFVSLIADQATKLWARETLPTTPAARQTSCEIPDDLVAHKCWGKEDMVIGTYGADHKCQGLCAGWRLSFNPGSAFGLFHSATGARVFLSVIGVLAVGGMLWMLRKAREDQKALIWALGLVAGGAVGNLIDRVYYGVVTDFALVAYKAKEWPVFNVADIALVIGVGLMFLDIQGESKREKDEKRRTKEAKLAAERAEAKAEERAKKAKAAEPEDAA